MSEIDKYLKRTGQTFEYLFSGGRQYGSKVISDLASEANKNNQRITWYDDPSTDIKDLPRLLYRLENIS